jgi:hypothetical protein
MGVGGCGLDLCDKMGGPLAGSREHVMSFWVVVVHVDGVRLRF